MHPNKCLSSFSSLTNVPRALVSICHILNKLLIVKSWRLYLTHEYIKWTLRCCKSILIEMLLTKDKPTELAVRTSWLNNNWNYYLLPLIINGPSLQTIFIDLNNVLRKESPNSPNKQAMFEKSRNMNKRDN